MESEKINLAPDLTFKSDCDNCQGLCCISFRLAKGLGFGEDKEPGVVCKNYCDRVGCVIWEDRKDTGWEGCVQYDCGGVGNWLSGIYAAEFGFNRSEGGSTDPDFKRRAAGIDILMAELHHNFYESKNAISYIDNSQLTSSKAQEIKTILLENGQRLEAALRPLIRSSSGGFSLSMLAVLKAFNDCADVYIQAYYDLIGSENDF